MPTPHRARRLTAPLAAVLTTLLALTLLTGLAGGGVERADAAEGTERFLAGERYIGTFADPTVMRVGNRYVASATTTANLNLPVMTSTDLRTWTPRPALPNYSRFVDWRMYNDAMPVKSGWAATSGRREKVLLMSQWAPSLAEVNGKYVAAYSAAVRLNPRKSCIGIAWSSDPLGVYRDSRAKPRLCFGRSPLGAIDPEVFVNPRSGKAFLLWKQEGIPNVQPPKLMIRPLDASGTNFAPGSRKEVLATIGLRWEGGVVENPSMVRFGGRFYLFYSGNAWRTGDYATGYAVCDTVRGPCRKADRPLLKTVAGEAGPGGADAIVDHDGRLRLLYHAWDATAAGRVKAGALRRLHVATLEQLADGRLRVAARG